MVKLLAMTCLSPHLHAVQVGPYGLVWIAGSAMPVGLMEFLFWCSRLCAAWRPPSKKVLSGIILMDSRKAGENATSSVLKNCFAKAGVGN